jgi:hypothetical protein
MKQIQDQENQGLDIDSGKYTSLLERYNIIDDKKTKKDCC